MAQMPDVEMLTAAMRQKLPIGPADGIDGEPPCVQNTPICIDTWPHNRDPQAARNAGYLRTGRHQRQSPRVIRSRTQGDAGSPI
jgi:hypothetical protein